MQYQISSSSSFPSVFVLQLYFEDTISMSAVYNYHQISAILADLMLSNFTCMFCSPKACLFYVRFFRYTMFYLVLEKLTYYKNENLVQIKIEHDKSFIIYKIKFPQCGGDVLYSKYFVKRSKTMVL